MKKLLLLVLTLVACVGVSNADVRVKSSVSKTERLRERVNAPISVGASQAVALEAATDKAPEGTWKSIGKGTYCEDLLTYYTDVPLNLRWDVEIEQNEDAPGWYRFAPYVEGSPIAEYYGKADNSFLYVNATDPYKVYTLDFLPYNEEISCLVPEVGWPADQYFRYGIFQDGIVSFELQSFAIGVGQGWQATTLYQGFKLAMPGVTIPDYTAKINAAACADDNSFKVNLTLGDSFDKVYFLAKAGEYPTYYIDPYEIIDFGEEIDPTQPLVFNADAPGLYTLLVCGADAEGNVLNYASCFVVAAYIDSDWKYIGKGQLDESAFTSMYDEIAAETVEVDVEESTVTPGLYRVVNPYASHSFLKNYTADAAKGHNHNHYLYVNASNPEQVYIEASPTGVEYLMGPTIVWSRAGSCIADGVPTEDIVTAGYFGSLVENVITMPYYTLLVSEQDLYEGEFFATGEDFKLVLPESDGVADVIVVADGVESVYNLQGQRVESTTSGTVYISVKDGKARKFIAR